MSVFSTNLTSIVRQDGAVRKRKRFSARCAYPPSKWHSETMCTISISAGSAAWGIARDTHASSSRANHICRSLRVRSYDSYGEYHQSSWDQTAWQSEEDRTGSIAGQPFYYNYCSPFLGSCKRENITKKARAKAFFYIRLSLCLPR